MDLSSLNDKQREAVTAPMGPVLVLAGAGSGKTRVLTYRVAYIIEGGAVAAENILALTFTNKAAKEMQTRVMKLLGDGTAESVQLAKTVGSDGTGAIAGSKSGMPTMGTFHSIGAKLLRKEIVRLGYGPSFVILDSDDQLKVLREIAEELGLPKKFPPTLFRAYISSAKNLLQTPNELNLGLDAYMHDMVQQVYVMYQNFLFKQNSLDFDDLLMLPIKLFETFPDVLRKYRELFKYILVDEYQDTNQAQYMFLFLLASHRNIFVVGDDAQSIYGFRGSNIGNILNFEHDYSDARVIKLEQNYRSTKNILAAAQKVIEMNSEQKAKTLWTDNPSGSKIVLEESFDGRSEAVFVAKQIIRLSTHDLSNPDADTEIEYEPEQEDSNSFSILDHFLKKSNNKGRFNLNSLQLPLDHTSLNDFAILYRTHAQSRELEEALIQCGIPYQIVGGVKFYERKEIKDVFAFMRLTQNFRDLLSIKRVINEPARGLGPKAYSTIKEFVLATEAKDLKEFRESLDNLALPPKGKSAVNQFFGIIAQISALGPGGTLSDLLRLIIKTTGIEEWLRDGTETGEARVENVRELFNVTIKYNNLSWHESLPAFLEEVALVTDMDRLEDEKDAVTLMTLHSAKGLEFDTVFFVGLEEGLLPHAQSMMDPKQMAEEVRLAYVGLTRARERLYLLYARSRRVFGNVQANIPSRILRVLPPGVLQGTVSGTNMADSDNSLTYEPMDE